MVFFHQLDASKNKRLEMTLLNDLWFLRQVYASLVTAVHRTQMCLLREYVPPECVQVNILTKAAEYELWHQRLMHSGHKCLDSLHLCTTGTPKLTRHRLQNCHICNEMNPIKTSNKVIHDAPISRFGDRFQMDFDFMSTKRDRTILRSHDGYSCYLLIVDYFTRYLWVFLSKNKMPLLKTVAQFLRTYGNTDNVRIICTDQGGELAKSLAFRNTAQQAGYNIEITGADNSAQNAVVERPHRPLANMVRTALENSGLDHRYWSDALLHAAYVKNRLPHAAFHHKCTPYEKLTGQPPDLSSLHIFGSRIVTRKPGKRRPLYLSSAHGT